MSIQDYTHVTKHKLLQHSIVYIISNIIRSAIPFFLLPILTRYLNPADYGIIATFQVLLGIMPIFIGLNTSHAFTVNYFKINRNEIKIYIGNVLIITIINFLIQFMLFILFRKILSNLLGLPGNWITIIVIASLFQTIIILALNIWVVKQKPIKYAIYQFMITAFNMSISITLIVIFGWGWQGRMQGLVTSSVVFGLLGAIIIWKNGDIKLSFNKDYIKDALLIGTPLIPFMLGSWIMTSIDRFFINAMVGLSATGIYTVGYQVGLIIKILSDSFNRAWMPFLFDKLKNDNYSTKVKIVKFSYMYYILLIFSAVILSYIAPYFLRTFVGKEFYSSYRYVLWISLGYAASGISLTLRNYLLYIKKTYILSYITVIMAVLNGILNYILIKRYGAIGAAQATTITFFIQMLCIWIFTARAYRMPWGLRNNK